MSCVQAPHPGCHRELHVLINQLTCQDMLHDYCSVVQDHLDDVARFMPRLFVSTWNRISINQHLQVPYRWSWFNQRMQGRVPCSMPVESTWYVGMVHECGCRSWMWRWKDHICRHCGGGIHLMIDLRKGF